MYQAAIFSFKVSQNFIVYESAEDRNLRAIFNRVKKTFLAIFLPNSIATRMPYLPAKDELVSLDRLSSRGLWKWFKRFWTGDYMAWGSISLFGGFLEHENSLETLIVIFENVSTKGSFWLKLKYFEILVLTANSRYLQTAGLKYYWQPRLFGVVEYLIIYRIF